MTERLDSRENLPAPSFIPSSPRFSLSLPSCSAWELFFSFQGRRTSDHCSHDRHFRPDARSLRQGSGGAGDQTHGKAAVMKYRGGIHLFHILPGASMTIVRFYVGEDEEKSIVRLNQKMFANFDLIPPGASQPSSNRGPSTTFPSWPSPCGVSVMTISCCVRVAAQVHDEIKQIPDVSEVKIIGGHQRQVRVALDKARMAAFGIAPATLVPVLQQSNQQLQSGHFSSGNREFLVETGGFVDRRRNWAEWWWVCSTIDRCTFGMSPPLWTARKNQQTTC